MTYHLLIIIWLSLNLATTAQAGRRDYYNYPDTEPSEDQDNNDGLDGLVSDLRRSRQGRVLSTDTFEDSGRPVHRIRILNENGRVRPLHFDGATGRPLPRYRDRYGE